MQNPSPAHSSPVDASGELDADSLEEALDEPTPAAGDADSQEDSEDGEVSLSEALERDESEGENDDEDDEESAGTTKLGPGEELSDEELERQICALLFASVEPVGLGKLVTLLQKPRRGRVKSALASLEERLRSSQLPMQVRAIKGGYALMTEPEMGPVVERLLSGSTVERVSAAALETLAVVAYRQPVTKAEIEAIRGVQAGPILRSLVDRGLIKVSGRADVPGSPLQYATTKEFLDRFGLSGVSDLPRDAELA